MCERDITNLQFRKIIKIVVWRTRRKMSGSREKSEEVAAVILGKRMHGPQLNGQRCPICRELKK